MTIRQGASLRKAAENGGLANAERRKGECGGGSRNVVTLKEVREPGLGSQFADWVKVRFAKPCICATGFIFVQLHQFTGLIKFWELATFVPESWMFAAEYTL